MTLTTSMRFLLRHPALPALFGLLLAPLAYLSAARGFDAVRFAAPTWQGLLVLGAGWCIALLLCVTARRGSRTTPPSWPEHRHDQSAVGTAVCRAGDELGLGLATPPPEHRRRGRALGQGRGCLCPAAGAARRWRDVAPDCVGLLGGLWGSRLALHLWRRVRSEPEDGRYRYLREHWQSHQGKIFGFFMAQALLVVLFALPFVAVAANPHAGLTPWTVAAALAWLLSVGGEPGRPPTRAFPRRPGEQGPHLPRRALALFTPPQLLLRVAALVHLCAACRRLPCGGWRGPGRC